MPQAPRRGQFPYAYIRSKLSVLPEEQAGQLSRRESMNQHGDQQQQQQQQQQEQQQQASGYQEVTEEALSECLSKSEVGGGGQDNPSLRMRKMALRRKRSLSVADLSLIHI